MTAPSTQRFEHAGTVLIWEKLVCVRAVFLQIPSGGTTPGVWPLLV
jgi:hypothetical protein